MIFIIFMYSKTFNESNQGKKMLPHKYMPDSPTLFIF